MFGMGLSSITTLPGPLKTTAFILSSPIVCVDVLECKVMSTSQEEMFSDEKDRLKRKLDAAKWIRKTRSSPGGLTAWRPMRAGSPVMMVAVAYPAEARLRGN
jgi:hypothetical protein